jgi:hypothetical protein
MPTISEANSFISDSKETNEFASDHRRRHFDCIAQVMEDRDLHGLTSRSRSSRNRVPIATAIPSLALASSSVGPILARTLDISASWSILARSFTLGSNLCSALNKRHPRRAGWKPTAFNAADEKARPLQLNDQRSPSPRIRDAPVRIELVDAARRQSRGSKRQINDILVAARANPQGLRTD